MNFQVKLLLLFLLPNLFFAQTQGPTKFTSDYIALTVPHHYYASIYYVDPISKTVSKKKVHDLAHDKTMLDSFTNIVSNVTVYNVSADGKLSVLGVGASIKGQDYQVIYDFSQTQTIEIKGEKYNTFLVGISVRMVAKFKALKGGINISSPFSLVANIEKIEGSLEVRVSGIGSQKINSLIPTPSDLSPSSIATALQAVATIKSHIYNDDTIINPQVLAFSETPDGVKQDINKLNQSNENNN